MFILPGGATVAVEPVAISLTDNTVNGSNLTTYTFSSQSLGTAAASRQIVVGVIASGAGPARTVSSLTIGGVSASLIKAQTGQSEGNTEIWSAAVPSGTTGDVVVVLSSGWNRCGFGVWRMTGASTSASDTGGSVANPLNDSLDIPANGGAIGLSHNQLDATTDWTNLDEDYDEEVGASVYQSGASKTFAAAQSALSITAAAGSSSPQMALASWGPA